VRGASAKAKCQKKAIDAGHPNGLISSLFHRTTSVHDMSIEIKIRKNEPIDRALRRMKKKLERENIIRGARAKRYYEKPCEKRRRKEKTSAFNQMLRARYAN
jgi:small subunit ribosomal protein S21